MAPVALILGGIGGTISALFGWLLFGLSFWGAVQVYFCVALLVAAALIITAMLRSPKETLAADQSSKKIAERPDLQRI